MVTAGTLCRPAAGDADHRRGRPRGRAAPDQGFRCCRHFRPALRLEPSKLAVAPRNGRASGRAAECRFSPRPCHHPVADARDGSPGDPVRRHPRGRPHGHRRRRAQFHDPPGPGHRRADHALRAKGAGLCRDPPGPSSECLDRGPPLRRPLHPGAAARPRWAALFGHRLDGNRARGAATGRPAGARVRGGDDHALLWHPWPADPGQPPHGLADHQPGR